MSLIFPIMFVSLIIGLFGTKMNPPKWMLLLAVIACTIAWYAHKH